MEGCFLRFYVHEELRHQHKPAWEWLMHEANKMGIRGGSAFKAMANFGRHRKMHEAKWIELVGLAVEVEFIVTDDEATRLIELVRRERLRLFYARIPAKFAVINPDPDDAGAGYRGDAE